ncbi:trehalase family glycosidase [Piscirickettsia litoralis]|uniref:Glycoside hydrolase n=1 Tax=Piscirickettsia litoralis TaxID=1891921 RepID=A0ABX3A5K4_9GAMM|nr:trehalase family glycosidase [Piscirickettsia litoralis]ODN43713.1 hypothetical protein BGC07_13415 [Piscirickettsia litoralis]
MFTRKKLFSLLAAMVLVTGSSFAVLKSRNDYTWTIGQLQKVNFSPVLSRCLLPFMHENAKQVRLNQSEFQKSCVIPYINGAWLNTDWLLRTPKMIDQMARDKLMEKLPGQDQWPVYYPPALSAAKSVIENDSQNVKSLVIVKLPKDKPPADTERGERLYGRMGLLYLPNAYVVPGGIFNEMYGWDSYFIIRGMLESAAYLYQHPKSKIFVSEKGQPKLVQLSKEQAYAKARELFYLAKGMVDNHIFEIDFYGGFVLNGNRSYYLTRSQPPLFMAEALAVYNFYEQYAEKLNLKYQETLAAEPVKAKKVLGKQAMQIQVGGYLDWAYRNYGLPGFHTPENFKEWLSQEVLPAGLIYFNYWIKPDEIYRGWNPYNSVQNGANPRVLTVRKDGKNYRLYTYGTEGYGAAAETIKSTQAQNRLLYQDAAEFFKKHPDQNPDKIYLNGQLTQNFYAADRAIRASGYDLSGRYGPQGQRALDYGNVALTSLLYKMSDQLKQVMSIGFGENIPRVYKYTGQALTRWQKQTKVAVNQLLWQQEANELGFYSDRLAKDVKNAPLHPYPVKTDKQVKYYPYGTMFYPGWAGLASEDRNYESLRYAMKKLPVQEDKVTGNNNWSKGHCLILHGQCEQVAMIGNYGIQTSLMATGNQWDYPYTWAPVNYFAAGALMHLLPSVSGKKQELIRGELDKIERGWLSAVDLYFANTGRIIEKYNVISPVKEIDATRGYSKAQVGFGWSNAVYMLFYRNLANS